MPKESFAHVDTWVFDLDNTLYPPSARLFDQIEARMTAYVMDKLSVAEAEADRLRAEYWRTYGTTLAGLMARHDIDPLPYLDHVHDIDLGALSPAPDLIAAVEALPGRKIVYTNGSRGHAERVTAAVGLSGAFEAMFGIEDAGFAPKPDRTAFDRIFALAGVAPARAAMVEDDARNLEAPHQMGMRTVWAPPEPEAQAPGPHVHHVAPDLAGFLALLA